MSPESSVERRVDLDWIRILAFGTLILYHVGMYYVTWDWHVKSPQASHAVEPLMLLASPWRLSVLFLVSGAATAFIAARLSARALARTRTVRLLVPLLFGMLVVVPPQAYFEVVEKLGYANGFADFYRRYLSADQTFCRGNDCLILPTWNHLWFVAYLLVYTLLLAAMLRWGPPWRARLTGVLERALSGWGVLLLPWIYLAAIRIGLAARFPATHALVDDWYSHALYLPMFLLGFLVARSHLVWDAMEKLRWVALLAAVASYAFITWYFLIRYAGGAQAPESLRIVQRAIFALDQWAAIVAACGFARRHLRRDGPVRRYLTEAIFPFYIVHQTAIILFAVAMRPWRLPAPVEAALLVALVGLTCVATYELARRVRALRLPLGLKPAAAVSSAP